FSSVGPRPIEPRSANPAPPAPAASTVPLASDARPETAAEPNSEPLGDVKRLVNYGTFIARSVRRHTFMAVGTVALVVGLTTAVAVLLPKTYHIETKLFAQRNAVMAALSNPSRAVPWDADA